MINEEVIFLILKPAPKKDRERVLYYRQGTGQVCQPGHLAVFIKVKEYWDLSFHG